MTDLLRFDVAESTKVRSTGTEKLKSGLIWPSPQSTSSFSLFQKLLYSETLFKC